MKDFPPRRQLPADREYIVHDKVKDISTNPLYGTIPAQRTLEEKLKCGVINLDKPANPTSHEVAAWVRKILRVKKTGHGGTLDPQVTGVLPVSISKGIRAVQVLLPAGKEYVGIGKVHGAFSKKDLNKIARRFFGRIYQIPPVRSNVKRRLRVRQIYYFDILDVVDQQYLFRVGCQAGTYIRKLCVDVGVALGYNGHMKELRRTRSGPFNEQESITLQDLRDAAYYYFEEQNPEPLDEIIQPIEAIFKHLPYVVVRDSAIEALCRGAALTAPGIVQVSSDIKKDSLVWMKSLKGEAIALGNAKFTTNEILQAKKGIMVATDRVMMEPGTYPKGWKSRAERENKK